MVRRSELAWFPYTITLSKKLLTDSTYGISVGHDFNQPWISRILELFALFVPEAHPENCRLRGYFLVPRRARRQLCISTILPKWGLEDRPRLSMRPCAASEFHLQYR